MCIGIFSFRAFDRRLARLDAPISSGVRQGGRICPPSGARSAEYPSGARVKPQKNSLRASRSLVIMEPNSFLTVQRHGPILKIDIIVFGFESHPNRV